MRPLSNKKTKKQKKQSKKSFKAPYRATDEHRHNQAYHNLSIQRRKSMKMGKNVVKGQLVAGSWYGVAQYNSSSRLLDHQLTNGVCYRLVFTQTKAPHCCSTLMAGPARHATALCMAKTQCKRLFPPIKFMHVFVCVRTCT